MNANHSLLGLSRQPKAIHFGPGQRFTLPAAITAIGRHALFCTDARMAGSAEFQELVTASEAAGVEVVVYAGVEAELPRSNVEELVARVGATTIDVVVGIGGGSCLDMAKVASVMLAHGGAVSDYYGEFRVPGPATPLITMPTTGGTGAEITCIAVVYDPELKMKVGVASPFLEAQTAIVDPELTLSCPPGLTAATGADALSHLVEAFTARAKNPTPEEIAAHLYVGKNLLTDGYCRVGLGLIGTSLPRVYEEPGDLTARSEQMLASLNAGLAINTTGTAGMHALQSPIGALTHTPHGVGVGTLLPYVARFNLPERLAEFAEIGRLLGAADGSEPLEEQAHLGIERAETILAGIGVPRDLAALGLDRADIPEVARQAMQATRLTANNPRELTIEAAILILEKAYEGDHSWWS
ncbi:MAG TPA: iron-containing alcohol dehydrogenase [Gryllotalpicola sp.]